MYESCVLHIDYCALLYGVFFFLLITLLILHYSAILNTNGFKENTKVKISGDSKRESHLRTGLRKGNHTQIGYCLLYFPIVPLFSIIKLFHNINKIWDQKIVGQRNL